MIRARSALVRVVAAFLVAAAPLALVGHTARATGGEPDPAGAARGRAEPAYAAYVDGNVALARRLASQLALLDPTDPRTATLQGLLELERGGLDAARERFRRALLACPDFVPAAAYMGHTLALGGDLAAARGFLARGLKVMESGEAQGIPDGATRKAVLGQIRATLGYVHLRAERWDDAVRELESALAIVPSLAGARLNLGIALYASGRTRRAADAFAAVLKVDPENADARFHLALTLVHLGHPRQAADELRRLVDSGRPAELARRARQILESDDLGDPAGVGP